MNSELRQVSWIQLSLVQYSAVSLTPKPVPKFKTFSLLFFFSILTDDQRVSSSSDRCKETPSNTREHMGRHVVSAYWAKTLISHVLPTSHSLLLKQVWLIENLLLKNGSFFGKPEGFLQTSFLSDCTTGRMAVMSWMQPVITMLSGISCFIATQQH